MSSIDFWAEGSREGYVGIGDKKPRGQLMDRSSGKETTRMISKEMRAEDTVDARCIVVDPDGQNYVTRNWNLNIWSNGWRQCMHGR